MRIAPQLSYQQVWAEKRKPILPRHRSALGVGAMQSETTTGSEYVAKTFSRPDPIVPSDNIRTADVPLQGDTTTALSYVKPGVIKPVHSYKPLWQYCRWGRERRDVDIRIWSSNTCHAKFKRQSLRYVDVIDVTQGKIFERIGKRLSLAYFILLIVIVLQKDICRRLDIWLWVWNCMSFSNDRRDYK